MNLREGKSVGKLLVGCAYTLAKVKLPRLAATFLRMVWRTTYKRASSRFSKRPVGLSRVMYARLGVDAFRLFYELLSLALLAASIIDAKRCMDDYSIRDNGKISSCKKVLASIAWGC